MATVRRPLGRSLITFGWGLAAPMCCTAIVWPLRHVLAPASFLMIYLLGVLLVATRQGRWPATLASLLSAPAFAFFFAPPIFSLAMKDLENVIALGVMLITAHVTSSLLERLRTQADIAARRERRATVLYRLNDALSKAPSEDAILRTAVQGLHADLRVRATFLFPDRHGQIRTPRFLPLPESFQGFVLAPAQAAFEKPPELPINLDTAIAGDVLYWPLEGSEGRIGILAAAPATHLEPADPEQTVFLNTLCNQIAQALERVRLAGQARDAALQAEAEALRNALLSAVSHDLRTPLTRIVGTASTLAERDSALSADERREFIEAIHDEARRMADLMSKVLDMARLTTGEILLHSEWNDLEELVGGTLNRLDTLLQHRPVSIRLPDHLPLLRGDPVLLQQVLTNLVENAVKYTPAASPIEIEATLESAAVRLTVADRGPGVPEALKARVFEKFYRQDAESAHSGVGLGLALCKAIIEAHGGQIAVADRAGGGAEFIISLPVPHQPAGVPAEEPMEVTE